MARIALGAVGIPGVGLAFAATIGARSLIKRLRQQRREEHAAFDASDDRLVSVRLQVLRGGRRVALRIQVCSAAMLQQQQAARDDAIAAADASPLPIAVSSPPRRRPRTAPPPQGKAEVVQRALEVQSLPGALPVQLVQPPNGER